jgi:hypothetical protein
MSDYARGKMLSVVGIDPGATGAAVLISRIKTVLVLQFSKYDWEYISDYLIHESGCRTIWGAVENVHTFGQKGMASKHNDFEFGKNTGIIHGILYAAKIPFELIEPKTWQFYHKLGGRWGAIGCTKAQEKTARKNAHKAKAQELFPNVKVTLETCDALLIAQYYWEKTFDEKTFASKHTSKH